VAEEIGELAETRIAKIWIRKEEASTRPSVQRSGSRTIVDSLPWSMGIWACSIWAMNFSATRYPFFLLKTCTFLSSKPASARVAPAVPKFPSVIDRKIGQRGRAAEPLATSDDCVHAVGAVAAGISSITHADDVFHGGETFVRLESRIRCMRWREVTRATPIPASFVGHI